jgi:hypothetical protein
VRLLHTIGGTTSQAASVNAANSGTTPFTGYSKSVAKQIVNWGSTPMATASPRRSTTARR